MSCGVRTWTDKPKRSSNCGRNSPSSGLPLPTRTKRAGWRMLRPSRSTRFSPEAATSIKRSTKWSSSKFTSSMYKKPRWAWASKPGENSLMPCDKAFSKSSAPTMRSSVAPRGKSTTLTARLSAGSLCALPPGGLASAEHAAQDCAGLFGSHLYGQPLTT